MMPDDKLSSWKEIATYLKCDERTARRWEQKIGLPIRRVGGSVFAFPREIDDWLKTQSTSVVIERSAPLSTPSWFSRVRKRRYYLFGGVVIILAILVSWRFFSGTGQHVLGKSPESATSVRPDFAVSNFSDPNETIDETRTRLKTLVKQSQIFEMLTLDTAPWDCDVQNLRFWEPGSKALFDTVEGASRFNEKGIHYGSDARLLDFEFRHVWISPDGLSAEVGTREHWWLPLYKRDGIPVSSPSPDQGPYEIVYFLDKIQGHWYLKSTSTPYMPWKPKQITCKNWHE